MILYESEVIERVCGFLAERGFSIEQQLSESQQGDDIIAIDGDLEMFIEAKGSTSSRPSSSRYGLQFSRSQVRDHIAMALYKAGEILTREQGNEDVVVGIALPKNDDHVELASGVWAAIERLKLCVFWVDSHGEVTIAGEASAILGRQ